MAKQDTVEEKLKNVDSTAWQDYAVEKLVVLENVVQDVVQQNDKLPNELLTMANDILKTSSRINSLKNHKKDFERLLGEASTLFVILWQSYIKSKKMYPSLPWPHPRLKDLVAKLVDTTYHIYKLMGRKSEKNVVKRVLLGCFGIRDLVKFNKYERRLGKMALRLQSKPQKINIHAVLLTVVNSRAQQQDEDSDSEPAGDVVEGDLSDKESAKKKATDKKPTAESSALCEVERSTSVKLANPRMHQVNISFTNETGNMINEDIANTYTFYNITRSE